MADNLAYTPGSGATVATDERTINSTTVHVQRMVPIGGSSIAYGQVTCTNSATSIRSATETQWELTLVNQQTVPVWIGDGSVTTSTGFRLDPGASLTLHTTAQVYGITAASYSASGDDKVHYISEVSA